MKLALTFWKYAFLSIAVYRTSFLMQAGFMMLNNALLLSIFVLFFEKFGSIGGMTGMEEYVPLFAVHVAVFGVVHTLFYGYTDISASIREWKLDVHLLTPKSPLLKILASKMNFSAIWDFISAFLFLAWFAPGLLTSPEYMFRFVIAVVIGSAAWLGIMIFYHSLGFFIGSSEQIAEWALHGMLWAAMYPPKAYSGSFVRLVLLTVFPAFWIGFFPYEFTISNWDFLLLGKMALAAGILLVIGVSTFHIGLKRYESGNLMVTNV